MDGEEVKRIFVLERNRYAETLAWFARSHRKLVVFASNDWKTSEHCISVRFSFMLSSGAENERQRDTIRDHFSLGVKNLLRRNNISLDFVHHVGDSLRTDPPIEQYVLVRSKQDITTLL